MDLPLPPNGREVVDKFRAHAKERREARIAALTKMIVEDAIAFFEKQFKDGNDHPADCMRAFSTTVDSRYIEEVTVRVRTHMQPHDWIVTLRGGLHEAAFIQVAPP